jgi:hypothetical protein
VACGTRLRGRHRERHLGAVHRLLEAQRHLGLEISPALLGARPGSAGAIASTAAGAAEDVREDVAEVARERTRIEAPRAAGGAEAAERPAPAVVGLALLGIGEDIVRLRDLLEALLRLLVAPVAVRVVLAREPPVGLLDLLVGGVLAYAEDLVVVGSRRHRLSLL